MDLIRAARDSLAVFTGLVLRTQDGRHAIPPKHLAELVLPVLEDDSLGHTVIVAPPGSGKTTSLIAAAAWWVGRDPGVHIGFFAATDRRAFERSVAVRSIVEGSPEYRAIFPKVRPDERLGWAEHAWYVRRDVVGDKDPTLLAAGVGSAVLGARLSRVILDDIADAENQATELRREKVREWLTRVVMTRLTPSGRAVMICTRWHEEDPAAWAIDQGWHLVHLRALDEEGRSYWPEMWPAERLRCPGEHRGPQCCKARELGTVAFLQQYQGEVQAAEAAVFHPTWWQRYKGEPPEEAYTGGLYIDTAGWTKEEGGDYAAFAVWLTDGHRHYLAHAERGRMDFPAVERRAIQLAQEWDVPIVVEETPWARPLIQRLRQTFGRTLTFQPGSRSKLNRARAVAPVVEAGDCYIPEDAPWLMDWLSEHTAFPYGAHDDWVDTTVMHLLRAGAYRRRLRPAGPTWTPGWSMVSA